jgi:hypothetical protein
MLASLEQALAALQRAGDDGGRALFAPDGPLPVDFDAALMLESGVAARIDM